MRYIITLFLLLFGCEKKEAETITTIVPKPIVSVLIGGSFQTKTSESSISVESMPILTSENITITPALFRIVSEDLLISNNQDLWLKEITVSSSSDGKIQFFTKPNSIPNVYRIYAYPIMDNSLPFSFNKNLSARFFIEVRAGNPVVITDIKSELFEDKSPYNNIKDTNESWMVASDISQLTYLTVGPIKDQFGNNLNDGKIQLTISEGNITTENPVPISDGFAFFSYQPTGTTNELTVSASIQDISGVSLIKNVSMKLAKPNLVMTSGGDFTNMLLNETKIVNFIIKNEGILPLTNLNIVATQPYILEPETTGSCVERGVLRSQESCQIKISYTRSSSFTQNGSLQIIGQPSSLSGTSLNIPLLVSNVEPTRLVASQSVISFNQISCGDSSSQEIYITNTGSFDAQNVNLTQPISTVVGQPSYFSLRLPPADANPSSNLNDVINCGNIFPAGRKCRVFIDFNPQTLISNPAPVIGLINADSTPSISISINGSSKAGPPSGEFPVNFYKFGTQTTTTSMYAQNGQKVLVRVGPILDSCGLPVIDGTVATAIVSAGTLNSFVSTTSNGYADFTWNSTTSATSLGQQSIVISTDTFTKLVNLTFQGVLLNLSGPFDLGQVLVEIPKEFSYDLINTGNIRADGISFNFPAPLSISDYGTCLAGLTVNQSCTIKIKVQPTQNQDYSLSINAQSTSFGVNTTNMSGILLSARNRPVISSNSSKLYFNDGGNSTSITKNITITNNGPAIAYDLSLSVEPPYVLSSTTCGSSLNVNESCVSSISVARSSSIGAGVKYFSVNNEFEQNTLKIPMTYTDISWSNPSITLKKYFCNGPYNLSSVVDGNVLINLGQNTPISLSSATGNVQFYSDSNCLTKINATQINANSSISPDFYLRSFEAEPNNLIAQSSGFGDSIKNITTLDIANDLLTYKPALAIKNMACILCHSNVKGNIYTDFGFTSSPSYNHLVYSNSTLSNSGTGDYLETIGSEFSGIPNGSQAFGTSFIEGKIYTPKVLLQSSDQSLIQNMLISNKPGLFDSNTPTVITTVADYLNSILPHRTTAYLDYLKNYTNSGYPTVSFAYDSRVNPYSVSIREVNSLNIGSISSNQILSFLDYVASFKYYKWNSSTSADLTNFGLRYGNFYGNDPTQIMTCEGDIFVDGPVYLKSLQLSSSSGCRIYATGTVFIEASASAVARAGITYISPTSSTNLQIASAKGILLGLSASSIASRKTGEANFNGGVLLNTMDSDVLKMKDNSNTSVLQDANDSGSRLATFSRLLLSAPRVDSRYIGDFSGVIIAKFGYFSQGDFTYLYDSVFNSVPILPLIDSSTFFSVQDCIANNIDQAIVKDSSTNYRSCSP